MSGVWSASGLSPIDQPFALPNAVGFHVGLDQAIYFALEELKVSNIQQFKKLNEILFIKKNSMKKTLIPKLLNKLKFS